MSLRRNAVICLLLLLAAAGTPAQEGPEQDYTPLRLSYLEGSVSFWRPGATDWVEARLNTALAPGDGLYTGGGAILELQLDSRAFIRADENTQLTVTTQAHGFLQMKITGGRATFDLRELPEGYAVEIDTPNALFNISHSGTYRLDVGSETHFITRRGGMATVVPAGGEAQRILPSEQVVVQETLPARVATYIAPQPDPWDQWNITRSEDLIDSLSARYVPPGVAGVDDLDHYGNWRVVPDYGPVWVPNLTESDWAPYSSGSWVWDPTFEWTWVDDAPWGWAPYHYGRWVYVDGFWAWAPGPVFSPRPDYAPALVDFYGQSPEFSPGQITPALYWVALGWGEPLHPWWGHRDFRGHPTWRGWGGPHRGTAANGQNPNAVVTHAIVYAPMARFSGSHGHPDYQRLNRDQLQSHALAPLRGELPLRPNRESRVGAAAPTNLRPPATLLERPVISAHPPVSHAVPERSEAPVISQPVTPPAAAPRIRPWTELPRPEFGNQGGDERVRPINARRFGELRRPPPPTPNLNPAVAAEPAPRVALPVAPVPAPRREFVAPPERQVVPNQARSPAPSPNHPAEAAPRREERHEEAAHLPGQPANQTYRQKSREKER